MGSGGQRAAANILPNCLSLLFIIFNHLCALFIYIYVLFIFFDLPLMLIVFIYYCFSHHRCYLLFSL
jgi:hypothetical protein